jgi:prepilin peptidase CpaA
MKMDIFLIDLLIIGMGIAALWDLKSRKIPNLITYPMMLAGLVFHGLNNGFFGLGFSSAGLLVGTSVFLIPYILGGMGAGDAKLMGGAGAILGTTGVIIAAVISVLIGFVYAIVLLLVHHDYGRSFLKRSGITLKTFFFTRRWVPIPPGEDEIQPILSYALPIAIGTLFYIYLKVTGSTLIQDVLGFKFSI